MVTVKGFLPSEPDRRLVDWLCDQAGGSVTATRSRMMLEPMAGHGRSRALTIVAAAPSASATPARQVKREAIHRSSHKASRPQERRVPATSRTPATTHRVTTRRSGTRTPFPEG